MRRRGWDKSVMSASDLDRLAGKLDITDDGCWRYIGAKRRGYGFFSAGGKQNQVHRLVYKALVGPIPDGLQIDHLCHVTDCFNPDHLEAVTPAENLRRSPTVSTLNAAKTACIRGHDFTPENTHIRPDGARTCRACDRLWRNARNKTRREQERSDRAASIGS